jgi:hypothetical protein
MEKCFLYLIRREINNTLEQKRILYLQHENIIPKEFEKQSQALDKKIKALGDHWDKAVGV